MARSLKKPPFVHYKLAQRVEAMQASRIIDSMRKRLNNSSSKSIIMGHWRRSLLLSNIKYTHLNTKCKHKGRHSCTSCEYEGCDGCVYEHALNYDEDAKFDDSSWSDASYFIN